MAQLQIHESFLKIVYAAHGEEIIQNAIYDAVVSSYVIDYKRDGRIVQTADEDNRRIEFCIKIMRCLYDDKMWGINKTLDHLAEFLRKELDGIAWIPDDSTIWVPGMR